MRSEGVTRVRQNVSVEFPIPEQVVGFVIGRKGSSVKQVEAESGARVHFKDQQGTTDKVHPHSIDHLVMWTYHLVMCIMGQII